MKDLKIEPKTSVGEIVKMNFKTAQIFEKNKIDFCCGGGISIDEACKKNSINIEELISELEATMVLLDADSKYINELELDELSDYIEKRHHSYVNENIPFLQQKLQKLCTVHGHKHPELFEIKELFDGAAENLSVHMKKEELILFPYIKNLVTSKKKEKMDRYEQGKLQKLLNTLHQEHEIEGERFEKIKQLSSSYTCPSDGCGTYRVSYQTLKEFENDLHRHIHLENNILFKKALLLESQLMKNK